MTPQQLIREHPSGSAESALEAAIDALRQANRDYPCAAFEEALIDLRIRGFGEVPFAAPQNPPRPGPAPVANGQLAEIDAKDLTAAVLSDAVESGAGLIVRNLMPAELIERMKAYIDRALQVRSEAGDSFPEGAARRWYARSSAVAGGPQQFWSKDKAQHSPDFGSLWMVDSPAAAEEMTAFYHRLGLRELLQQCFGEPAVLSVKKWVLRKATPKTHSGWHQDGRFLGQGIRSINLWVSLSTCGGDTSAPGMEILADQHKRIHDTGTRGAMFDWIVGPELVDELAQDTPVLTPEFAPGDAIFFDHYNLHRTQCNPRQTDYRYAVESWFFAASRAPAKQYPLLF